ncbi:hypothetical protein HAX54_043558, partial [Datura stramonium]|nr:hypothetical protein [Datura stramonium]
MFLPLLTGLSCDSPAVRQCRFAKRRSVRAEGQCKFYLFDTDTSGSPVLIHGPSVGRCS